jgi:hypothetical protein
VPSRIEACSLQKLIAFASGRAMAAWKSFMPPSLTRGANEAGFNPRASTHGRANDWMKARGLTEGQSQHEKIVAG